MIDASELMSRWLERNRTTCENRDISVSVSGLERVGHGVASALLDITTTSSKAADSTDYTEVIRLQSHNIAREAMTAKLSYDSLANTVQGFQLVLVEELAVRSDSVNHLPYPSEHFQLMLQRTDQLAQACLDEYRKLDTGATVNSHNNGHKKTLQHEIRTPLQGALLSSELLLEDVTNGEAVSIHDVQAIRTSIETAIKVLNDFAKR